MFDQDEKLRATIIDASTLKKKSLHYHELQNIIFDIIRVIQDEITIAMRNGKSAIVTTIPSTFTVTGLKNTQCQTFIYGSIIKLFKEKKYNVSISVTQPKCILKISWDTSKEDDFMEANYFDVITKNTDEKIDGHP